jgi:hypothetical protein
MFLDYFALALLFFVVITLFYAVIAIHDVPYEVARRREHPHQDAIHAAGSVSLFPLSCLVAVLVDLSDVLSPGTWMGIQWSTRRSSRPRFPGTGASADRRRLSGSTATNR